MDSKDGANPSSDPTETQSPIDSSSKAPKTGLVLFMLKNSENIII